jgi:hypothetical protein
MALRYATDLISKIMNKIFGSNMATDKKQTPAQRPPSSSNKRTTVGDSVKKLTNPLEKALL